MIKKIGCDYYRINKVDIDEKTRFSLLEHTEKIDNIARMYSKMITIPFEHKNVFEFKVKTVIDAISGLEIDYFEFTMIYMNPTELKLFKRHIGLIRGWIKI